LMGDHVSVSGSYRSPVLVTEPLAPKPPQTSIKLPVHCATWLCRGITGAVAVGVQLLVAGSYLPPFVLPSQTIILLPVQTPEPCPVKASAMTVQESADGSYRYPRVPVPPRESWAPQMIISLPVHRPTCPVRALGEVASVLVGVQRLAEGSYRLPSLRPTMEVL